MNMTKLFDGIGAVATNTVACAANTPFTRGSKAVLMICPDSTCDFTVQFLTDDATTGSYVEIIAAHDYTDKMVQLYEIEVPHNLRAVIASRTAGTVDVYMLGNV